jgi:ribosomal-protein-alanine N-acetyltransferase
MSETPRDTGQRHDRNRVVADPSDPASEERRRLVAKRDRGATLDGPWRALTTSRLETTRLRMRYLRRGDGRLLAEAYRANRAWLEPWEPARPRDFHTSARQERIIEAARKDMVDDRGYRFIAFERGGTEAGEETSEGLETFVGLVALSMVARGAFESCSLGYWVAESKGGRGLGKEMVGEATRWAFDQAGLHRVQAAIQPENEFSRRLIEALGYRLEGRARNYLNIAGGWRDHDLFAKTIEDHLAERDGRNGAGES